ncbi:hypothetical protein LJC44_06865 [Parabacteroides sp. OttesenSCG-928-G06]|nr:hypothetical protein [Parabacteroides sp. OttesenSCG-928-G06]
MFNYKGITSSLEFGETTIANLKRTIDIVYEYFKIIDQFPQFEIIIHPDYKPGEKTSPETRKGLILLCTDLCDSEKYDYYQQITWQFSHELVHVCKGFNENRENWVYLPDEDEEEILAGGIAIKIMKDLHPSYDYTKEYSKSNLAQCEEMAESLKDVIHTDR